MLSAAGAGLRMSAVLSRGTAMTRVKRAVRRLELLELDCEEYEVERVQLQFLD
jgi:hypothetical protein